MVLAMLIPTSVLLNILIKIKLNKLINKYNKGHITNIKFIRSISSYYGWLVNGDCKRLFIKLINSIKNKNRFVKLNIAKLNNYCIS